MYLVWQQKTIELGSNETAITALYNDGFVFTRVAPGSMDQTRSVRIDLSKFELSSENRRVLKKTEGLTLNTVTLPYAGYNWQIGKLAKDFYDDKFGHGTFSANKIKELLTEQTSNFNRFFVYTFNDVEVGYCIAYENLEILHYSYPFYDRATDISNLGLGMMLRTIVNAQEAGKKYIYLGSAQRPTDTYKLQFTGLEWFDGEQWQTKIEELKKILTSEIPANIESVSKEKEQISKKPISAYTYLFQSFCEAILANIGLSIIVALAVGLTGWSYYLGFEAGFDHNFYAQMPKGVATYNPGPYKGISNQFKPSPVFVGIIGVPLALFWLYVPKGKESWNIISIAYYSLIIFWTFYFYKKNTQKEDTYYHKNKKRIKKCLLAGVAILVVIVFGYGFFKGIQHANEYFR